MVQCMEAWFIADPDCLGRYFGRGFHRAALPGNPNVERVSKADVLSSLQAATRECQQAFSKGRQSFEILERLNPDRILAVSPHFARLVEVLGLRCRAE